MKHKEFVGRTAVITAGGGAICGAVARSLAAEGAAVAVWDLNKDAAHRVAEEICAHGGRAIAVDCDCTNRRSVEAAAGSTERQLGAPDLLVNGAGGSRSATTTSDAMSFFEIDAGEIDATLALNYRSAVTTSQVVVEQMVRAAVSGAVVNVASVAGLVPLSRATTYSDSKAALVSFTRWLAVHISRTYSAAIRVNAVAPGFVLTDQNRFLLLDEESGEPTARGKAVLDAVPCGRYGKPEEIAEAVVWLLSSRSSFVNGTVLTADGGFLADSGV